MKSVAKLRAAGFTIAATNPDQAVDCTTVASTVPFFYFNPNFASNPADIIAALKPAAEVSPGVFELILGGQYFEEVEIPYEVVPASLPRAMDEERQARAEVERLKKELEVAERRLLHAQGSFNHALRNFQ